MEKKLGKLIKPHIGFSSFGAAVTQKNISVNQKQELSLEAIKTKRRTVPSRFVPFGLGVESFFLEF